jgi:hypothetical protein
MSPAIETRLRKVEAAMPKPSQPVFRTTDPDEAKRLRVKHPGCLVILRTLVKPQPQEGDR